MTDKDTKGKILKIAHELFSQKGYDGVSVREISSAAGVNISAISYHFENKEKLFQETIRSSMTEMSNTVKELREALGKSSTSELALTIYDYFIKNSENLKLSFKMFVIDAHIFPHDAGQEDDFIGPPGGKVIFDCIMEECPNAKEDDVIWAVRTIFTQVVHKALLMSSHCVNHNACKNMSIEDTRSHIARVVRVVLNDL
ncbi:MAG: hypothetical protein CMJ16_02020 [Peredibacter sp.]|nr:hypothetical protein [Peredibacter sp.]|tara:strand:- start:3112 stop:3708 length:597 start_codon:yes stop_codon:yes gene_type:complete